MYWLNLVYLKDLTINGVNLALTRWVYQNDQLLDKNI
jgi:hypothetical protein